MTKDTKDAKIGLYYMVISSFCVAIATAIAKILSHRLSPMELVFFRNIFGVLYILFLIYRKPLNNIGGKPFLLLFRGFLGALAILSSFYIVIHIGLAEAITYQQSYPIFLSIISVWFLKAKMTRQELFAIMIGFSGICLIFGPQFNLNMSSAFDHSFGIFYAIIAALAYLSIAELSKVYENRTIVLVFMTTGVSLPLLVILVGHLFSLSQPHFLFAPFVLPDTSELLQILLMGVMALMGQIYVTKSFAVGNSGQVSAMGYSQIVFSIILGILIGDPFPSILGFAGILLIILSGVYIAFFNTKRKKV
jgi:drug/metabolite transporter (DMT)-like permease